MDYNNKSYKDSFEDIEVPIETDLVIEKAIRRAKNRYKRRFLKISASFAAVFVLLIFLSKTSPAFADYINNAAAPVKNLFSHFQDKGIDNAVKNGFVQEAPKDKKTSPLSASDKGITVTIDQVAVSGNKLIIGYTLKADEKFKNWEDLNCDKFKITDDKGRVLYDNYHSQISKDVYSGCFHKYVNKESFKSTGIKQGIYEFSSHKSKIDEIPDSITIEFYNFIESYDFLDNNYNSSRRFSYNVNVFFYRLTHKSPKLVEGDWAIPIKIDDKFKNAKEIKYVEAKETNEDLDVKIEYLNVYPTTANAKFSIPRNMHVTSIHIEDEKGNKYKQMGGTSYTDDTSCVSCPDLESPFFEKTEKLYLVFDCKGNGKNKNFKIELKKQ